jgi:TolB-like protein
MTHGFEPNIPLNVSKEAALEQVDRILSHPDFTRSRRLRRFLRFVVEQTAEGKGSELSEYYVGTSVYDRPSYYDPRTDPIVRVEAGRLRRKLAQYYAGPGAEDPLVIDLPKSSYEAAIVPRGSQTAAEDAQQRPAEQPRMQHDQAQRTGSQAAASVAVLPFADLTPAGDHQTLCHEIAAEVARALREADWLHVTEEGGRGGAHPSSKVSAVLEGSLRRSGDAVRVSVRLNSGSQGFHLWSQTYTRPAREFPALRTHVAEEVLTAIEMRFRPGSHRPASRRDEERRLPNPEAEQGGAAIYN